jgi:hypothetical protein
MFNFIELPLVLATSDNESNILIKLHNTPLYNRFPSQTIQWKWSFDWQSPWHRRRQRLCMYYKVLGVSTVRCGSHICRSVWQFHNNGIGRHLLLLQKECRLRCHMVTETGSRYNPGSEKLIGKLNVPLGRLDEIAATELLKG